MSDPDVDTRDLEHLCKLCIHYRKMLWIFAVPSIVVGPFFLDSNLPFGAAAIALGVAAAWLARSKRNPARYPGTRLLLENAKAVNRIIVQELPGMVQLVLANGDRNLSMLEIENPAKTGEALDIVKVYAPDADIEHRPYAGTRFIFADFRFWERF